MFLSFTVSLQFSLGEIVKIALAAKIHLMWLAHCWRFGVKASSMAFGFKVVGQIQFVEKIEATIEARVVTFGCPFLPLLLLMFLSELVLVQVVLRIEGKVA
jgi:hypothetical protein